MFKVALLPRNLEACQRDLPHADPKVRLSVLRDLARGGAEEERGARLELLSTALHDDNADVRRQALITAADESASELVEAVVPLLSDVEIRVRQMAVMCLGEIANPDDAEVVGRLACLLAAGDPSVRYQALLAHSQLRPGDAADDILRALGDEDAEIRELAVRLVDEVLLAGDFAVPPALDEELIRVCKDPDPGVRLVAQLLAGDRGLTAPREMIFAVVARRFRVREPRDEQLSLELTGHLELQEAIPDLTRRAFGRLGFSLDPFRWNALGSLCRLGSARAFERLRAALSGRSYLDRTMAAKALGDSLHPDALALLKPLTENAQALDPDVLASAIAKLESSQS